MATSPHLRVLIVDDEMLIRWSIAEVLAQRGHAVVEASTARAAMDLLDKGRDPVDVILLDFRLPDSNDLGLLASIRQLRPGSAVVMMTAFGSPEMTRGALELGAYRVVDKPFDMHHLDALVRDAHNSRAHPET
jgi:DNA-binding NtrC family response regulator